MAEKKQGNAGKGKPSKSSKGGGAKPEGGDKTLQVEERLLLSLPALTEIERRAFRGQFSDAQCDAYGSRTKAEPVCREARSWAATIDAALRKQPQSLRRYGTARFAWMLECVRDLHIALEAQASAKGGVGASRRQAGHARESAIAARDELLEALGLLAGGKATMRAELSTAAGTTENAAAIARSLRELANLADAWLKHESPEAKALVSSVGLTPGDSDTARKAADALDAATGDATLGGKESARDAPTVNRAEGRVLLEMRTVMRIFERAHEKSALVPRLNPGPATRTVLRPRAAAEGKEEVIDEPSPKPEGGG